MNTWRPEVADDIDLGTVGSPPSCWDEASGRGGRRNPSLSFFKMKTLGMIPTVTPQHAPHLGATHDEYKARGSGDA